MRFTFVVLFFGCAFSFLFSLFAILSYIKVLPENFCDMTYMYQYPEYVKIQLNSEASKSFPNYGLFVYGEGFYADQLRKAVFDGLPVLFIPGNAGSYRQVRSLASVSLVKTAMVPGSAKFNYFTIDFDEELSGLYGGYLKQQTKFVSLCIKTIVRLYPKDVRSTLKIILVGHSIGGLIARGVVSLGYTNPNLISFIFTLATPNIKPVISFDYFLTNYYENVKRAETAMEERNASKIFYVSVGGGFRDILVPSRLTTLETGTNRSLNAVSSSLTNVWSSTDHLCIVWCNQLVRLIVRALFDLCDKQSENADDGRKRAILDYHFTNSLGPLSTANYLKGDFRTFSPENLNVTDVEEYDYEGLKIVRYNSSTKYVKICPGVRGETNGKILFVRTNQALFCILYACSSSGDCNCAGRHDVLPHSSKIVHYPLQQSFCYYAPVYDMKSDKDQFLLTVYDGDTRNTVIKVGNQFLWSTVLEMNGNLSFYNISLEQFVRLSQAFDVRLIPTRCRRGAYPNGRISVMNVVQFHCPWNKAENLYQTFRFPYNDSDKLVIRYQFINQRQLETVKLLLFLDPSCDYQLIISSNFLVSLGQILRFYFEFIPDICIYILILILVLECFNVHLHFVPLFIGGFYAFSIFGRTDDCIFGDIALFFICVGILTITRIVSALIVHVPKFVIQKLRKKDVRSISVNSGSKLTMSVKVILFSVIYLTLSWYSCGFCIILFGIIVLINYWLEDSLQISLDVKTALCDTMTSIFTLYLWLLGLSSPSFIVWIKQLQHGNINLVDDPTFPFSVVLLLSWIVFSRVQLATTLGRYLLLLAVIYVHYYRLIYQLQMAMAVCLCVMHAINVNQDQIGQQLKKKVP